MPYMVSSPIRSAVRSSPARYSNGPVASARRATISRIRSRTSPDIWVHDLERGTAARVTFDPASEMHPVWSPDGRLLFFSGDPGGEMPDLFRQDLTATKTELFLHTGSVKAPADVSPDGRFLLYIEQHGNQRDIAVLPLTGER